MRAEKRSGREKDPVESIIVAFIFGDELGELRCGRRDEARR